VIAVGVKAGKRTRPQLKTVRRGSQLFWLGADGLVLVAVSFAAG
jgi:hypothetical protein